MKWRFTGRHVMVCGAPLVAGQTMMGVDGGPEALRRGGLRQTIEHLCLTCSDLGDSTTGMPEGENSKPASGTIESRIVDCHTVAKECGKVFEKVQKGLEENGFSLTIGGNHSIAIGSISAMLSKYEDLCVVWVDAHGDCNTPHTSPSGNYHGMPVAHLLGWFESDVEGFEWRKRNTAQGSKAYTLQEDRVAYVGLRDLDDQEKILLKKSKVFVSTMHTLDHLGIANVMKKALEHIDPSGNRPLYLSLDVDGIDPMYAPGTGTRARGGLTYREAHYLCEILAQTGRLVGMDLVEINPSLDSAAPNGDMHGDQLPISTATTDTVRLGIELVASALGKTID